MVHPSSSCELRWEMKPLLEKRVGKVLITIMRRYGVQFEEIFRFHIVGNIWIE